MTGVFAPVQVLDLEPANSDFLAEMLAGLRARPRLLPCKFFYDGRGSELFEQICHLPEYYVTRTETGLLRTHGNEISEALGPHCRVIEFGTGSGIKTRILLEHLDDPAAYVPVDISKSALLASAERLRLAFPALEITPICADYLQLLRLPVSARQAGRTVVFFPGSTIGNFEPPDAEQFLSRLAKLCGPGGALLIGVDRQKNSAVLERAYNDAQGVTAEFNLNLLARANEELGANFDLAQWQHRAIYNQEAGRIEMHLISAIAQTARVGPETFSFSAGEHVVTEFSYKYTPEGFTALAARVGFQVERSWTDDARLFTIFYLTVT